MPDIVVTLPAGVEWSEYEKELAKVRDGKEEMLFKVPNLPRVAKGDRCYIAHRGKVVGWMPVTGTHAGEFDCTTTGRKWAGKFVKRSGKFNRLGFDYPMKGFQGYRYAPEDLRPKNESAEDVIVELGL